MSRKKLSRSDRRLLASAWAEVAQAPRARVMGSSPMRSGVFSAKYPGVCERCGSPITSGQDIRFHYAYSGAVHDGCRAPKATPGSAGGASRRPRTTAGVVRPQPPLCPDCHTEHAGEECW
jgi:hypothetical protein